MKQSPNRYLKKSSLLKFCYVPAASAASSKGIFVGASNNTHKQMRQAVHAIYQTIFLRFLWNNPKDLWLNMFDQIKTIEMPQASSVVIKKLYNK